MFGRNKRERERKKQKEQTRREENFDETKKRAVSEKKYSTARERALLLPVRKREDRTSILCHGATRECRIPRACNDSRFDILKTHSERDRNEQKEPSTNRYVFVSEHWLLHERKRFICVRRNRVWSTSRLRRGG